MEKQTARLFLEEKVLLAQIEHDSTVSEAIEESRKAIEDAREKLRRTLADARKKLASAVAEAKADYSRNTGFDAIVIETGVDVDVVAG